ncbi:MAG TPA: dihydropteroate synthase [Rhizomicrobium sp.]|jgi:dihydropteroate synthase type 2|nr:dihydropteroate synthase [Rhizomicrobium sp.]
MTTILGILNITADSFFDGGRYLEPAAAIAQARMLLADGADVLDIGAASSNPDAAPVPPQTEIARLQSVLPSLGRVTISIDSYAPEVQRWALAEGVGYLNDIQGFPDPVLYPALAAAPAKLIVMHSVQARGQAIRVDIPPREIMDRLFHFFDVRLATLEAAGIARGRLILDPGMGFFLGTDPETSFTVLRRLPELKARYGLPILISVSRKSFLRAVTGKSAAEAGPASLAAELYAVRQGADYIRTHAPGPLRDALAVEKVLGT